MYTDVTGSLTTDLPISPYTFSKPDCGLSSYSISGSDASIFDSTIVRFISNAEATLTFSLVVTAIGNTPATLTIPSIIYIVDCSNGNFITGGNWDDN